MLSTKSLEFVATSKQTDAEPRQWITQFELALGKLEMAVDKSETEIAMLDRATIAKLESTKAARALVEESARVEQLPPKLDVAVAERSTIATERDTAIAELAALKPQVIARLTVPSTSSNHNIVGGAIVCPLQPGLGGGQSDVLPPTDAPSGSRLNLSAPCQPVPPQCSTVALATGSEMELCTGAQCAQTDQTRDGVETSATHGLTTVMKDATTTTSDPMASAVAFRASTSMLTGDEKPPNADIVEHDIGVELGLDPTQNDFRRAALVLQAAKLQRYAVAAEAAIMRMKNTASEIPRPALLPDDSGSKKGNDLGNMIERLKRWRSPSPAAAANTKDSTNAVARPPKAGPTRANDRRNAFFCTLLHGQKDHDAPVSNQRSRARSQGMWSKGSVSRRLSSLLRLSPTKDDAGNSATSRCSNQDNKPDENTLTGVDALPDTTTVPSGHLGAWSEPSARIHVTTLIL